MDVFLSYVRSTSRDDAVAVHRELGGSSVGLAFLDSEEIEHGERFPERLIDALLASRVVVVFANAAYFARWYCILEFRAARAPFTWLAERAGTLEDRLKALEPLVVVLPPDGAQSLDQWSLPPELQRMDWPTARDPAAIAEQVRRRLSLAPPTLAERLDAAMGAERFRREWLDATRLPPGERIPPGIPFAPARGLPASIGERFVGRADDLWRIHDTLTTRRGGSPSAATLTASLEGGAGVGKSRLALEYLYRFGPRYYHGGLFWIDAERALEPQFYQVARALDPKTPEWRAVQNEPDGVVGRLVSACRALPPNKPALVVVDNIPAPSRDEPPKPLDDWFPASAHVSLLVTSRNRVSLGDGAVVPLPVGPLDAGAAHALLIQRISPLDLDEAGWREMVAWVDGLPFALELVNRALAARAFTANDLLNRLRSEGAAAALDQAMDALRSVVPAGSLRGATEVLALSYERLPSQAKAAAELMAWLAPAPIPEALIEAFGVGQVHSGARSILIARSLLIETPDASVPMLGSMHRIHGDFLRTRSEDRAGLLTRLTGGLLSVMSPRRIHTPREWPLVEACEPHAAVVLDHVAQQQPRSEFVDHTASLALALASWYLAQGLPNAATDVALRALIACGVETNPGQFTVDGTNPAVQDLTRILGPALTESGKHDPAIEEQRIYLEWLQQERSDDDPDVLRESDNLAWMLYSRGSPDDLEEAHETYTRTVVAWRLHEAASRDTLTALNNLGLVEQKRGNVARAAELFEEVLEGLRHMDEVEMETIQTLRSLASVSWETDPVRANTALITALAIADRIELPDTHWAKLRMLTQLGGRAHALRDYAHAQPLLRRAVEALAATYGDHDPQTTIHAWALWDAHCRTGDSARATETRRKYLDWLRATTDRPLPPEQDTIRTDLMRRDTPRRDRDRARPLPGSKKRPPARQRSQ